MLLLMKSLILGLEMKLHAETGQICGLMKVLLYSKKEKYLDSLKEETLLKLKPNSVMFLYGLTL